MKKSNDKKILNKFARGKEFKPLSDEEIEHQAERTFKEFFILENLGKLGDAQLEKEFDDIIDEMSDEEYEKLQNSDECKAIVEKIFGEQSDNPAEENEKVTKLETSGEKGKTSAGKKAPWNEIFIYAIAASMLIATIIATNKSSNNILPIIADTDTASLDRKNVDEILNEEELMANKENELNAGGQQQSVEYEQYKRQNIEMFSTVDVLSEGINQEAAEFDVLAKVVNRNLKEFGFKSDKSSLKFTSDTIDDGDFMYFFTIEFLSNDSLSIRTSINSKKNLPERLIRKIDKSSKRIIRALEE